MIVFRAARVFTRFVGIKTFSLSPSLRKDHNSIYSYIIGLIMMKRYSLLSSGFLPLLLCITSFSLPKSCSTEKKDYKKMVDPRRVVSYEDMLKVIHQPEKVIIDVRDPDEVTGTGKIPSSINIPLGNVQDVLSMTDDDFKKQYQRRKPSSSDELIFYCRSGRRSSEALDRALKLGYKKSKTYIGSWEEWSSKQKF